MIRKPASRRRGFIYYPLPDGVAQPDDLLLGRGDLGDPADEDLHVGPPVARQVLVWLWQEGRRREASIG